MCLVQWFIMSACEVQFVCCPGSQFCLYFWFSCPGYWFICLQFWFILSGFYVQLLHMVDSLNWLFLMNQKDLRPDFFTKIPIKLSFFNKKDKNCDVRVPLSAKVIWDFNLLKE